LHCNNHSSTSDSISSERQAFQVPSLHHGEEESLQAFLIIFNRSLILKLQIFNFCK